MASPGSSTDDGGWEPNAATSRLLYRPASPVDIGPNAIPASHWAPIRRLLPALT